MHLYRPQRRALLRTVLTNFLNTPPQQVTPEAARLYAELAEEARVMLREIAHVEAALLVAQPNVVTTTAQEPPDAS